MKDFLKWLLITCVASITLAACDLTPKPVKTDVRDAAALVDSLEFHKSKIGVCFGITSVRRMSSGGHLAENQMITYVPCKEVGL